jgi:hypothetical protein
VTADPNTAFVEDAGSSGRADLNNIFLVQTDGAVYKVPLTTPPGTQITVKHFTAAGGTVVSRMGLTPNKVIIATGLSPSGGCNPTCNNGLIAVDKVNANTSTVLEAAVQEKIIVLNAPFGNQVRYSISEPPFTSDGAARIIEDASSARVLVGPNGFWNGDPVANAISLIARAGTGTTASAFFVQSTGPGTGTVSVLSAPTGPATLLGSVTASMGLAVLPLFGDDETQQTARIGIAPLEASPTNNQPFFADATTANSLTLITTPGLPAPWNVIAN